MNRNILHRSQLEAFKVFLDAKGRPHRGGKGEYQVLQVKIPGQGWEVVSSRNFMPDHFTVSSGLMPLVKEFLRGCDTRELTTSWAEELEKLTDDLLQLLSSRQSPEAFDIIKSETERRKALVETKVKRAFRRKRGKING